MILLILLMCLVIWFIINSFLKFKMKSDMLKFEMTIKEHIHESTVKNYKNKLKSLKKITKNKIQYDEIRNEIEPYAESIANKNIGNVYGICILLAFILPSILGFIYAKLTSDTFAIGIGVFGTPIVIWLTNIYFKKKKKDLSVAIIKEECKRHHIMN